ncbi:MAG TPA: DUF2752 domain-containing protein [Anaeromyxobacter sp.]|nr:DUF2752 domain-containing protein [Anaeromyxobacter sp.]
MEELGEIAPGGRDAGRAAERFGVPEVYATIAALSFLVARFVPVLSLPYQCPFRALTGIPCASCGMTHAFVHLAHGHLAEALRWSPLGALLAAGAWAYAVADLVRAAAGWPLPRVPGRLVRPALGLGVVALLLNWAWLAFHGLG